MFFKSQADTNSPSVPAPQSKTMAPLNIPDGFAPCPKGVSCPSCKSKLIKKIPAEVTVDVAAKPIESPTDQDDLYETAPTFDYQAIQTSLESARCANLLLQAMSFDAATREKEGLDGSGPDPVSGVSYCPTCKVHVITDPTELTTLFDKVTNGDESCIEEALRGRLYVCVSEDDVASLAHRKEMGEPACSYDIITPNGSDLQATGASAMDFDYEYRHGVATKAMGRRITQGYTMRGELCDSCEMPLMAPPNDQDGKECVVCPTLDKIKAKFTSGEGLPKFQLDENPTEDSLFEIDEDDPVTLIIAEARRAIKTPAETVDSPGVGPVNARTRIEEAKKFLASKAPPKSNDSKDGTAPLTPDPSQVNDSNASTIFPGTAAAAVATEDWDTRLLSGRSLFSERIQQGWTLSTDNCIGAHCKNTPLLSNDDQVPVCTVCGGTGTGTDGAYATSPVVQWEDLVTNGRSILMERLKQGWTMSSENCNGVNCKGMPLTQHGDGPLSCVVCGGTGSGYDGAYEGMKSNEVLEAERALVTQEISYLMSMGWVLRDSFCDKCQMPLVAETMESEDVCILCGQNNPLSQLLSGAGGVMDNACFDDNANEAGQRIKLGWRLADASPLCVTCGGIQMEPPGTNSAGCINRACPMVHPAALATDPNSSLMEDQSAVGPRQRTGSEVLKKVSDKLSISRLLKDGLVPLMVCGAPDYTDDQSALSDDMSMFRNAPSTSAMGAILARLDQAKYQLEVMKCQSPYETEEMVMKQGEIAMLIEQLANAAVAMKQLEDIEARDPPAMCM